MQISEDNSESRCPYKCTAGKKEFEFIKFNIKHLSSFKFGFCDMMKKVDFEV
jgi:hypothetical protein